jgi:indolepyruvate ferredoxin oxidoreductase
MTKVALANVALDDKYKRSEGRVYMTGTQALVRLPMLQRELDRRAGLNTAGYVTGYRGSPLGGIDLAMTQAGRFLAENDILFQPGVNEELAATALWGSQQTGLFGDGRYDGVFGMWYAKGPGVDRSGDALRHANLAGTAPKGGVLALAGDDHTCKSSTTAHQSDYALMDANIPILYPATIQDVLEYGLYGWAMSRFTGCWVGMKMVAESTDVASPVLVDHLYRDFHLPQDLPLPPGGRHIKLPETPFAQAQALEQERILLEYRLPAVAAFARFNPLDRVEIDGPKRRLGIISCGKSHLDLRQAMEDLGLDPRKAADLGISVYKVALTWPLEATALRDFAAGLEEILVVEEKRSFIEMQLKQILYDLPADRRPRILGKTTESGAPLLPAINELTPGMIAEAICGRLRPGELDADLEARLQRLLAQERNTAAYQAPIRRFAYFCSGCPHSTSTKVPEGSRALAGIGCHFMAQWMDRDTATYTQMGAEGATWVGQAPFSKTPHVFQNIGDGTYFHSGLLAIRAAVAAKVNVTFKILFNDAVAMTGGQHHDGPLSPLMIASQLSGEGIGRIAILTEDLSRYPAAVGLPAGATLQARDELDAAQRELREIPGVTAIIYDQTCAAEKRRRRKRGQMPDPARRVFINEDVCEGCGDCSRTSNCLSVTPLETAFGRKRQIDQSSCNKDFSCLDGFCPSFVTVEGAKLRRTQTVSAAAGRTPGMALPEPVTPDLARPYNILVTGIGGTGVVTIGALLGMAAHLEGKQCTVMDQTGLAQKGGAVVSHIRLAAEAGQLAAVRLPAGSADLLLGCDLVVSAAADNLSRIGRGRSIAIVNDHETITGAFTRDPDFSLSHDQLADALRLATGTDRISLFDATRLATALMGDAIFTNPFMLGYAYQRGLIPLGAAALLRAIELNGAAVDRNKDAFTWGRQAAVDLAAVQKLVLPAAPSLPENLADILAHRMAHLAAYQNDAYAGRYRSLVDRVAAAEAGVMPGKDGIARAVARNYAKLLAYKDEYEVARLYRTAEFRDRLDRQFESGYRLRFHLAPPSLAYVDPTTGHPRKHAFGGWMMPVFGLLAQFKGLRGSAFDPFARTAERQMERRLIADYEALIGDVIAGLTAANYRVAVQLAELPQQIRGFGHVKTASVERARLRQAELLAAFNEKPSTSQAAE